MNPLVSVVIPAYNGDAFLRDALRSVVRQTETSWEAIVVDDGSIDTTPAIAREAAAAHPRIHYVRQDNCGTQPARNAALARARGAWVALLDQDDVWAPEKLEKQLALLDRFPNANLLFTNYTDWDGSNDLSLRYRPGRSLPAGDITAELAGSCLFQASTVLVPRALVSSVGGFDPAYHFSGDWHLWLKLALRHSIEARGTREPLVRYRIWGGNESLRAVRMHREVVAMLEMLAEGADARRSGQAPALRRSARRARARLELAELADPATDDRSAPERLWRAWRCRPSAVRLLLRALLCALPEALGGRHFRRNVVARLRRKHRPFAIPSPLPASAHEESA
ncbi:hypothetical protein ASA1KI_32840 [Opitutales bacterium ASA1]|uniref:glycosyltransferase family 2 protein n=1 Tax=Congregicoccus parvus TaxID=3081749 RepID=UPI002B2E2FF2|nr:hypothetical protein ASA1KI_32840 [Opitutales bacterium ASA1]